MATCRADFVWWSSNRTIISMKNGISIRLNRSTDNDDRYVVISGDDNQPESPYLFSSDSLISSAISRNMRGVISKTEIINKITKRKKVFSVENNVSFDKLVHIMSLWEKAGFRPHSNSFNLFIFFVDNDLKALSLNSLGLLLNFLGIVSFWNMTKPMPELPFRFCLIKLLTSV